MKLFACISFLFMTELVSSHMQRSPALLWSPERSMVDLPDVASVDSFSASDLYSHFLMPLMQESKENAVVFLQDKLSVDDFTKYADVFALNSNGGAFKNIKRLVEDNYSLELPEVESPASAVESLKENFDGIVHNVRNLDHLKSLELSGGRKHLLIVDLQPVAGASDVERAITQNDALIGETAKHLQDKGFKYSALFTGRASDEQMAENESGSAVHSGRHLLAVAEEEAKSASSCSFTDVTTKEGEKMYVYLCGFKVCIHDATSPSPDCAVKLNAKLNKNVQIASDSVRAKNTARIVMKFDNLKEEAGGIAYTVKVNIDTTLRQDRWTMDKFSLDFAPSDAKTKSNMTVSNGALVNYDLDSTVPRLFSFHCTQFQLQLETIQSKQNLNLAGSYVMLEKFQFQVYDVKGNRFFYAQDCVGFFSAGIWMGVFTGLLLVGLLIYGTLMVLNLSVMDKFDNPKGKTISVNVNE